VAVIKYLVDRNLRYYVPDMYASNKAKASTPVVLNLG